MLQITVMLLIVAATLLITLLMCCACASSDPSTELDDEDQWQYIEQWRRKHGLMINEKE